MNRFSDPYAAKKLNQKGSTLVWVMVVILVLMVTVGSVLTIGLSYTTRSTNNNAVKQAYFTARSVAKALAYEMTGTPPTVTGAAMLAQLDQTGKTVALENIQFEESPQGIGTCRAVLKREALGALDTILITATATVGTQEDSVALRLNYIPPEKGNAVTGMIGVCAGSFSLLGNSLTVNGCDLYSMEAEFSFDKELNLSKNLYSKGDIVIKGKSHSTIGGDVVTDGDVTLKSALTIGKDIYAMGTIDAKGTKVGGTQQPNQLVSKLPPLPKPVLPKLEEQASNQILPLPKDAIITVGASGKNEYYKVQGGVVCDGIEIAPNAKNVFIYLESGSSFLLFDGMTEQSGTPKANIYFIVEKGATLSITNYRRSPIFYGYIYAEKGATVNLTNVTMHGAVHADKLECRGDVTFNYIAPTGSMGAGEGSADADGRWEMLQYEQP